MQFLGVFRPFLQRSLYLGYMERTINRTIQTASSEIEVLKNADKWPRLNFQDNYKGSKDLEKTPRNNTPIVTQKQDEGRLIGLKKPKSLAQFGIETIFHAIRPQIAFKKKIHRTTETLNDKVGRFDYNGA